MDEKLIASQALGLRSSIFEAMRRNLNCHYSIGVTLNALREELLFIRQQDRESLARTILPIYIPKVITGEWVVANQDAHRLFSQLYLAVNPGDTSAVDFDRDLSE